MTGTVRRLDRVECLELMRTAALGRVGLEIAGVLTVLPVNFAVLDDHVVFRSAPGSKLSMALMGARVAFEVDDADPETGAGWSVLVVGAASEVTDPRRLRVVHNLPLHAWAGGERDHVIRIATERVTGRRVGPVPAPSDARGTGPSDHHGGDAVRGSH